MGAIGKIREHSGLAVAIVGIAIVAFIIGDLAKNKNGVPEMGKIDGNTISAQHFHALTTEMEEQVKRQQGIAQINSDMEYQIREQVWNDLVQETLLNKEYKALGIQVTPGELSDMYSGQFIHPYLRQMFTDPQTGQYNVQAIKYYTENFDQLDTNQKMQWVELEKNVKKDRAMQKYSTLISQGMYMPKAIAAKIAEIDATQSDVLVASVSLASVSDDEAVPTEDEYKAYYEKHKAEFKVREEVRQLDYILYPINPTQQDLAKIQNDVMKVWEEFSTNYATADMSDLSFFVTDESDRSFDSSFVRSSDFPAPFDSLIAKSAAGSFIAPQIVGNQWMMAKVLKTDVRPDSLRASVIYVLNDKAGANVSRTDAQASSLADSVLALLKGNKLTFDEAVKQYSDNKETDPDMGWVLDGGYGFMNEDVVNTPVDGYFKVKIPQKVGYFIVKVTGKSTPEKKYSVALITRNIVASEKTSNDIYNAANKFAGQNRTYDEMIAAASNENLSVRSEMISMMMNQLGSIQNARSIIQWAYEKETGIGDVAAQVYTVDNGYVVCALKDIYKVGTLSYEQARPMFEQQARNEKKKDVLMAKAEKAAQGATNVETVAAKLATTVDTVAGVSFNAYYFGKFGMEPMAQASVAINAAKGNKKVLAPIRGANGVYVMQIANTVKNEASNAEAVRSMMEQQAMQKTNAVMYVLREKAKIVDQRNKHF